MTSTASGKVEKFRFAALLQERQHPEGKSAAGREADTERRQKSDAQEHDGEEATMPSEAALTLKRRSDQFSPACASRRLSGTRLAFLRLCSNSLSVPSTCRDAFRS